MRRRAAVALALWVVVALSRAAAAAHPAAVERLYARGLYPLCARALSMLFGSLPFSLAEVLLVLGLAAMAWLPVRAWRRRRSRRPSIARGLISLLAVTGAAVVAFDLLW